MKRSFIDRARQLKEAAARIFGSRKPPNFSGEVMEVAERIIKSGKVRKLPQAHFRNSVRVAVIDGRKVVFKNTKGKDRHGHDYEKLRRTFLQHQLALRQGIIKAEKYSARTPKAYGRIGKYLVMQYVEGKSLTKFAILSAYEEIDAAYQEMKANFAKLKEKGLIEQEPQLFHVIIGNRSGLKRGKVVFYFVYDYG